MLVMIWVLRGFAGFCWVLLGFTWFYWVLLGFTGFYWVLLGFTGFYWVLLGFTVYYCVLLLTFCRRSIGPSAKLTLFFGRAGRAGSCKSRRGAAVAPFFPAATFLHVNDTHRHWPRRPVCVVFVAPTLSHRGTKSTLSCPSSPT